MDDPLDETLRRAADAMRQYEVPERIVAVAADSLAKLPTPARSVLQTQVLADAVLRIAETHAHTCVPPGCPTCEAISDSVAALLAMVRAAIDTDFGRRLASTPPGHAQPG